MIPEHPFGPFVRVKKAPDTGALTISFSRSKVGAATKSRTRDLLITNQLLYQLSYSGSNTFKINNLRQTHKTAIWPASRAGRIVSDCFKAIN